MARAYTHKVSNAYGYRLSQAEAADKELRREVRIILIESLTDATQEKLYDVTPNKTTGRMLKSISHRFMGRYIIEVGYGIGLKKGQAPWSYYRIRMRGRYKKTGASKVFNPGNYLGLEAIPRIRAVTVYLGHRIAGFKGFRGRSG